MSSCLSTCIQAPRNKKRPTKSLRLKWEASKKDRALICVSFFGEREGSLCFSLCTPGTPNNLFKMDGNHLPSISYVQLLNHSIDSQPFTNGMFQVSGLDFVCISPSSCDFFDLVTIENHRELALKYS